MPHLNLFLQAYQSHLTSERKDGSYLNGAIQLLTHTAKTIEIFTSKLSVSNSKDQRLGVLTGFHSWLERWQRDAESKNFLSTKLWFDLQSMIQGVKSVVSIKLSEFPNSTIKLWIINQDLVENHFCQLRACNGQNNNPTYRLQESAQNSIRYGQTTVSRKSNVGKKVGDQSPFCPLKYPDKV